MKEPEDGYLPGTWLRFQRDGRIVIGAVQYVQRHNSWSWGPWKYITDVGEVGSHSVLEAR